MLRCMFLIFLPYGLVNPMIGVISKDMNFKKLVLFQQASSVLGIIITITLTFILKNTWAFIAGFVIQSFVRLILSYTISPFFPKFSFNYTHFKEISNYAKGIAGAPLLAYFAQNLDVIVGSKMLSPETIGMYGFAIALARTPRDFFAKIINPVLIPAFSSKQNNLDVINNTIYKISKITSLTLLPILVVIFFFRVPIITTVYSNNFSGVADTFAIFSINVLIIIVSTIFSNLFLAIGKPGLVRNCSLLRTIIIAILIVPAIKYYNINGIAMLLSISNFIMLLLYIIYSRKIIKIDVLHLTKQLKQGVLISIILTTFFTLLHFSLK